jgi:formamidopyrimidine-DNA glycosylase
MPELPEVEALARFLDFRTRDSHIARLELASFSALKTVEPRLETLLGARAVAWRRRGKYLCLETDRVWLVIHLARGGWIRWYDQVPGAPARPGRSPITLRMGFGAGEDGQASPGLDLTEAGTAKRVSLWVVSDPERIPGVAGLGIDPLDPAFDSQTLGRLLGTARGTIKSALTSQSLLAGIGNAYSDEALHAARLSPFRRARSVTAVEVSTLHRALIDLFRAAVTARSDRGPADLKDDKRAAMRVHGRTGLPCPSCGDTIFEVAYGSRALQYCPTCQTNGRHLADRRLSRLMK